MGIAPLASSDFRNDRLFGPRFFLREHKHFVLPVFVRTFFYQYSLGCQICQIKN